MVRLIVLTAPVLLSLRVFATCQNPLPSLRPELQSPLIATKVQAIVKATPVPTIFPQYTDRTNGVWKYFEIPTWTSGFFGGLLYLLDTRSKLCHSKGVDWLAFGRDWSVGLVPLENDTTLDHDVGFLSYPFQAELLVNPHNTSAQNAVIKFASTLASRFNPVVGCTKSWDKNTDPTDFQVIIDNMMNLEVLFVAADINGNQTLRDIAIKHADTTMVNHFRPDGSTFHVVDYNSTTGAVIQRRTAQGYANNSTWTRGQSWAIYGYANSTGLRVTPISLFDDADIAVYNRTGFTRYLDTARRAATLYTSRLPSSGVPPWDFDAPSPTTADTSSGTIAATGLLLLARLEESLTPSNCTGADLWRQAAVNLLNSVTKLAWKPSWQSLLSNGTVNNRANPPNNLTGIVYGDYYYIQAGNMLLSENLVSCQ